MVMGLKLLHIDLFFYRKSRECHYLRERERAHLDLIHSASYSAFADSALDVTLYSSPWGKSIVCDLSRVRTTRA